MSKFTDIRAAVKSTMESVPGIGQVQGFERYAKDMGKLQTLYKADGADQLLGWYIRRGGFRRRELAATMGGRRAVSTDWMLRGFMALNDDSASEDAMQALVDGLVIAFDANLNLDGTVDSIETPAGSGLQLVEFAPVLFGGVLSHGVKLSLQTLHYE